MPQNESISYIKPKQTTVSPKWEISQPFQSRERKWRKQPVGKRGGKTKVKMSSLACSQCSKQLIVIKDFAQLVLLQA